MAEQLALEQRLGQRGAVDRDEGGRGPRAVAMDRVRRELLARAALAQDQDRRLRGRDPRDELVDLAHRRALADHVGEGVDVGVQARPLRFEPLHVADVLEDARRDVGEAHQDLKVLLGEPELGIAGVQIEDAEELLGQRDGNRREGADPRRHEAVGRPQGRRLLQVVGKDGLFFAGHVRDHGAAHPQRSRRGARGAVPVGRAEKVRSLRRHEEGPALGGDRLEGEPDQLLAELRDRADGRKGPARREQDLQVESDPTLRRRGCRGLDRARLQVARLRRREANGRAKAELIDPELCRAEAMPVLGSEKEQELRRADLDLVSVLEQAQLDRHAVDEGPVHALQIGDLVRPVHPGQKRVPPRGGRVRDRKGVRHVAPDRHSSVSSGCMEPWSGPPTATSLGMTGAIAANPIRMDRRASRTDRPAARNRPVRPSFRRRRRPARKILEAARATRFRVFRIGEARRRRASPANGHTRCNLHWQLGNEKRKTNRNKNSFKKGESHEEGTRNSGGGGVLVAAFPMTASAGNVKPGCGGIFFRPCPSHHAPGVRAATPTARARAAAPRPAPAPPRAPAPRAGSRALPPAALPPAGAR